MRVAIIGGTGKEGRGLALRWARKGHQVLIGSRDPARAQERAQERSGDGQAGGAPVAEASLPRIAGGTNEWAAHEAEVALLAVPYSAHGETLRQLQAALAGRVVIDITVPLQPPKVTQVNLPPGRAAAL